MPSDPLLVVQTYEVSPKGRPNYFEIHLAPDAEFDAPRTVVFTWDTHLYVQAVKAEGNHRRVHATWSRVQHDRRWIKILETFEAVA